MLRGPAYAYGMWKEYRRIRPSTSYASFRTYLYWLRKIGFVEPAWEAMPEKPTSKERVYLRITERGKRADKKAWEEPYKYYKRYRA